MRRTVALVCGVLGAILAAPATRSEVLVEAEAFHDLGGWSVDTQFIDIMGSPYLIAHGLGKAVANAKTSVELGGPGVYSVWVRTKNWVPGEWAAPGRFRVVVDGHALPKEFGAAAPEWGWESGGAVTTAASSVALELQDLTGFDGRCDAVLFSKDAAYAPDNSSEPLAAWRKELAGIQEIRDPEAYDLVVAGGGLAGTAAAVAAARMGLEVALVQNRPVLGGNGSSEVRVAPRGNYPEGKYPLGDIVREISPHIANNVSDGKAFKEAEATRLRVVQAEKRIHLFLNHHAYRVEMDGNRIAAIWALDTRDRCVRRLAGRFIVDATGHGVIGLKAGADHHMEKGGRMGMSNLWLWEPAAAEVSFPETPWALPLAQQQFPYPANGRGDWFWESGFDKDPLRDAEAIRDWNLRAVFGAWNAMKNHGAYASWDKTDRSHAFANLVWVAYIGGTRETLQLLGDVVVSREDIVENRSFPDSCVPATWGIDVHYPHPLYARHYPDNPFISRAHVGGRVEDGDGSLASAPTFFVNDKTGKSYDRERGYLFPYRCFYSRNIENLFMAGRDISVTHEALGTVRVMQTLGMVGVVVGRAAFVAKEQNATPREVYEKHWPRLEEVLMLPGKPAGTAAPGTTGQKPVTR
jgi:hypothetical protein